MPKVKSGSERPLESTPTFFKDDGMDEGAAKTSSGKQGTTTPSCSESSATTLQCRHQHHQQQHIQQQHLQHPSCHLALAMSLSDVSGVLDTFFNSNNTRTPARPKRQQATTAEALRTAAKYDDGACMLQQKTTNADADFLSMLEDPKGVVADGASRSFEALDDVFMLPGNSWSDMVHEMESEKKRRAL